MKGEWVSHGHLRGAIGALDDIRDNKQMVAEPVPLDEFESNTEPTPEFEEWDGRREAYRMFADKLWDRAANEDEDFMGPRGEHGCQKGNHHGQGGKHHGQGGKHHGPKGEKGGCYGKMHHGKHDKHDDDHKGKLGFCPVLTSIYIIMAVHFYYLYSYQKALSDEEFLEKANSEFNCDVESRSSTSAQHFFSNMMGPEIQRRQCQEVLTKQMAAPQ
jgi:hypothetical protein